ncbi:MAG: chromosome segregation protein SMC [Ruminococcus sp.]|jgi:chromosome segregation protein|nr:chromosome segregation protein SMC [Ruminococcus sp.]
MYLKSLELQGFKSFPDKLTLDFGKGMTAIVGPNGSGKSNIGDAIRWVLGEQSTKTLRGGKMEDVIFSGTQTRRAMGYAAVTLNIENDRAVLNAPAGLLSVTRKLYRTGESEYIINGSQARLKDILELFMDTGLGRDGYAIIGQGRVSEIVSNKSNDRREIFEEASGISKLRYKRDNANRDLTRAEESLVRLHDIFDEIKTRIDPLREQSEKAKKFIDIEERRRSLEISVWVAELDKIKEHISALDDEILKHKSVYETLSAEERDTEAAIDAIYINSQGLQIEIEKLRSEIAENERKNAASLSEIAVAENDINHAKTRIDELEKEIIDAGKDNDSFVTAINEKLENIKGFEASIKAEEALVEKTLESFNETASFTGETDERVKTLTAKINALYINESEFRFFLENSDETLRNLETQGEESKSRLSQIELDRAELKTELVDLKSAFEAAKESEEEYQNRIGGMTRLYAGKKKRAEDAASELENLRRKEHEIDSKVRILSDLEKNMEGFSHAVKDILNMSRSGAIRGIHNSVGGAVTVAPEYTLAIETALGAALQNVIVENEDAAKRCINYLKEKSGGRATFLPLTSIKGRRINENLDRFDGFLGIASDLCGFEPRYKDIFENLLGKTAVFDDLDSATTAAKAKGYSFKAVTLDGQVINAGGSFTGGSTGRQGGLLSRKTEIERLTHEREKITATLEECKTRSKTLSEEANKMLFDIEGMKEKLVTVGGDIIRFESEEKRVSSLLSKLDEDEAAVKKTISGLSGKKKATENGIEEVKLKKQSTASDIAKTEAELKLADEKQTELAVKRERFSTEISDRKLHITALQKDIEMCKSEIDSLDARRQKTGESSVKLSEEITSLQTAISQKEAAITAIKDSLAGSDSFTDEINTKISALRLSIAENEKLTHTHRERIKEILSQREEAGNSLSRAEERKKINDASFDDLSDKMATEYGLYYTEAKASAIPIKEGELSASQRELTKLKNQIKALGVVNLSAIEEYKELSERHDFMKRELDDVNRSKRELERLIAELTDRMKAMFSENFDKINTNFKRIFTELFGGGKASLTLSDPEDVLESGIDINVAPPGKVIKNLSLLSGGEQAFVAIAIYFAILSVKPSPFCILDEIEAALDDINVTKYARYLRKFTDTTQFICVTHRRGTMDEADVLYGVTMQEKGISRVISMPDASGF